MHPETDFSRYRRRREKTRKDHLLARAAVVEAARALGLLLLGNGNNGDGDGVELRRVRIDRKGYV
jgi:hypothetical protein